MQNIQKLINEKGKDKQVSVTTITKEHAFSDTEYKAKLVNTCNRPKKNVSLIQS